MNSLYWNTVNSQLKSVLRKLMSSNVFDSFRLVGGTSLSLQLGHRMSIDIDLFSDIEYGKIDFDSIQSYLEANFKYFDTSVLKPGVGCAYYIGTNSQNAVKLDVFYCDLFMDACLEIDGVRMATLEDIIAMKVDVIMRGGRMKDFWDIHELTDKYSLSEMILLHQKRYPYNHQKNLILKNFTDFDMADADFVPECLRGKHWEIIKFELAAFIQRDFPDFY